MTTVAALIGQSPAMVALRERVSRDLARQADAARRSPPILIQGETGTGKGLVAGTIYRAGMKRARRRAIAQSIGNPTHLWRTHAALARFHAARGTRTRHASPPPTAPAWLTRSWPG